MSDATDGDGGGDGRDGGSREHGHGQDGDHGQEPARSGRALLLTVFVGAVSIAGGFGFLIGSIGPRALEAVSIFGVTLFRPTPVGMALYGVTITGLVLGTVYVGARVASNREERPS